MALTAEEAAELAALEAEFGQMEQPVQTGGLTAEEAAELAMLEAEFAAEDQRVNTIRSMIPEPTSRADLGRVQSARNLAETAIDSGMTPEQYQQLLAGEQPQLSAEQLRYRADVLAERAQPNMAEDMLMGAASGALNAVGNTAAIVTGLPGSISNAINAPDIDDFMSNYDPASYADWSEQDKIALYNQEAVREGRPTYEEQLSSMPTVTDNMNTWRDISGGTVADYRAQTAPGKAAEFTSGLYALGGVGGPIRTAAAGLAGSTADQLTEGTALNLPATILATAGTAGLAGAVGGIDDAARAAANRAAAVNEARKAIDAATRQQGIISGMTNLVRNKEIKMAELMSMVRVGLGGGVDQSMFSLGQAARAGGYGAVTGGLSTAVNAGTIAMNAGNMLARNPVVQQTVRSAPVPAVKSITLEGGQIANQPDDIIPLTPGGQ